MSDRTLYIAVAVSALVASGATLGVTALTAPERADGVAVRDYILEHPEIIPEAMELLRARETAKAIDANRSAIETPFAGAWAGAEDGDVVLVEFFDYACGYCRASLPHIERLLAEDKGLKIVFRELPVLGPASETAARLSLAAAELGKHKAFHDALFAAGPPSDQSIAAARETAGLALAPARETAMSPAVQRELETNFTLARQLGFNGTPSWVVGDKALSGAVGYEALKDAIAAARAGS